MRKLSASQIQEIARAVQQLDSEPDRPRTVAEYWAAIGIRIGLPADTARNRAYLCGIHPVGLGRGKGRGEVCVFGPGFKR